MASTLIISEKNKAAQAIAEALGPVKSISFGKSLRIYYVPSRQIYVLPLRGHIQQYQNVGPYKKWTARNPRDIITDPKSIDKIPSKYAGSYIGALQKYGKICNLCVIGTDADVEGCNIGMFDAFPFVKASNPTIQVKQLWLNDLRKASIQKGYNNLIPPKWSWGFSGEARAIIDAIIGFSATREVSLTLKPILKQINVKFTSIGRVQTSLLYLLYLREHLIRNFNPVPFWRLDAKIYIGNQIILANHRDNNFDRKNVAESIHNRIKTERQAQISKIDTQIKKVPPPSPLNTSKALLLLTKVLKINATVALKSMEDLYLEKFISYPRTDSDIYAKDYDHLPILQKFAIHNDYGSFVQDRLKHKKIVPKQGKINAGDHSPITPLISLSINSPKFKNKLQAKVYDIISRSYLATFGEPAEESDTKILFLIKGEPFIARIAVLIKEGFLKIAPFLAKKYKTPLVALPKKDPSSGLMPTVSVQEITLEEKETQPPPRFSDTTLLKLMEQKKLGTKSTRPNTIQILLDRNYVERRNRYFYVMELGFLLMDALKVIWEPFLDPRFTAYVEKELVAIKNGQKTMQEVVTAIKKDFLVLFDKFQAEKPKFMTTMNRLGKTGNILRGRENKIISQPKKSSNQKKKYPLTSAKCPKCKQHPMKLVISQDKSKKFLVCDDKECKTFLSIPKKGMPRLLKETCSLCQFNIVKINVKKNNKAFSYYICPLCWTNGFANKSGAGFCSTCKSYKIEKDKCVKK
jgi:DNA topoisomerase-1